MSPFAAHALRTMVVTVAWSAALAPCAEAQWQPATVQSQDGSRFPALIGTATLPHLEQSDGQRVAVIWPEVAAIRIGDRWPIEQQKQAEEAIANLHSDDYATRQKALTQLRDLGAAAGSVLRKATTSDDPEVATRSRELLSEMGIGETSPDTTFDQIDLKDGKRLTGRLRTDAIRLHTRWGILSFPIEALSELTCEARIDLPPPSEDMQAIPVQLSVVAPQGTAQAFSMADLLEDPAQPSSIDALNMAGFDEIQVGDHKLQAGDTVESAYASKGMLLRATEAGRHVVVDDSQPLADRSGGLAACVGEPRGMGDLEIRFIQPGSYVAEPQAGRPAGVRIIGLATNSVPEGHLGLEAYDQQGRLLARCGNQVAAPNAPVSFMGVRATVPIVRLRVFRMPGYEQEPLRIDDILFDACVPCDRAPTQAMLELLTGERLVGRPEKRASDGGLVYRPAFLPQIAPAIDVKLQDIRRYEPPVQLENECALPRPTGTLHAVRLQNGEAFQARFVRLDAKQVALQLPGGVQMTLPRELVRKIDLFPQMAAEGAEPAALAQDEKPGVEFRPKRVAPGAQASTNQEAELPRMDNADIISADTTTGELTVDPKDGAGAWRIDLFSTRFLVFPPAAEAAGNATKREWILRLRQGGSFSIALTGISPDHLDAEMAGAKVTFPARVVATVERSE